MATYDYTNIRDDLANNNLSSTQLLEIQQELSSLLDQHNNATFTSAPSNVIADNYDTYTISPFATSPLSIPSTPSGLTSPELATEYLSLVEGVLNANDTSPLNNDSTGTIADPNASKTTTAVTEANQELIDKVSSTVDNPTLPTGAEQTYTPITENADELMTGEGQQVDGATPITSTPVTSTTAQQPSGVTTSTYDAATVSDQGGSMESAQGTVSNESLVDPEGTMGSLSEGATVQYTQEELDTRATIQGQMSALFEGYEDGEIPKWAQPAVDLAQSQLSALGLSKSTIARDSLYNAVIGTALNIAQNDANAYKEAWLMNMDTKYKVQMFNAAQVANMDMQNASYAQQAAIQNAQAFLQMDFANMENEQRTREINLQAEQQRLLSDQAATNAASQFNAESENQMRQFITQLQASIELDNAARADAMAQFNETNAIDVAKFNDQFKFQIDSFNAQMAQVIEQSNVEWRREINTTNTAGINAVNQANATNLFNMSNQALTFMWQAYRDDAYWAWMSSENELERQAKIAMSALTNETMADQNQWDAAVSIGSFIYNILN